MTSIAKTNQRLLALDIMRGLTIAGMILVNNAGTWAKAYTPLRHAAWNGLTPTDLVFPFFMFIMGVSTYLSLRKTEFRPTRPVVTKIIRRALLIWLIGLGLAWFSMWLKGLLVDGKTLAEATMTFDRIRILGVFPRLGICYGIGALLAVTVKHRVLPWLIATFLVGYALLLIFGDGFVYGDTNILARIDRSVIGDAHMYTDRAFGEPFIFDPEGLVSTLPSIAHMLIGFLCGGIICKAASRDEMLNKLFIIGAVMTFCGLLLCYGLPLNKKVWSPTFVLTTCGMASSLLALLIWIIDVKGWKRWTPFFHAFGVNPLYLYVQSAVLAYLLSDIIVGCGAAPGGVTSLKGAFYYTVLNPLTGGDAQLASCLWAILFVFVNWIPGYFLYRRKIYIKI
ncbi:MAG: DUF5009 domain-containing protein [Muribaculaceae bacterium]|nr:DUF5009 domain-containing protein [Muribaculaceae bacterium]